jgi:hypothetical protein
MADAFIKNGSIASAKIGTLSANKITSDFISADRIDTNSINASKLVLDNSTIASQNINGVPTVIIKDLGVSEAKIGNLQVSTLKIKDQAVTVPVSAFTAAAYTPLIAYAYVAETTIQTLSLTATGAPLEIVAACLARTNTGSGGGRAKLRLYRGSTLLYDTGWYSTFGSNGAVQTIFYSEKTLSAGSYTYTVRIIPGGGSMSSTPSQLIVTNRYLRGLETKK